MIVLNGKASRCFKPIIGEISLKHRPVTDRKDVIFVANSLDYKCIGYKGCICSGKRGNIFYPDHIYEASNIQVLRDGDIVRMNNTGNIHILWDSNSFHNVFMLTESCNCRCLMCPQPPKKHDDVLLSEAYKILELIKNKSVKQICITGGEPTLLGGKFIDFLNRCIQDHPSAHIDVLTNGKVFGDKAFTKAVAHVATSNVVFCVSLHSEIDRIHDYISGVEGSFALNQIGIYNLAEYGCKIEIRHVINNINANFLNSFAQHLYNYFPFCSHYAFMGMELYGMAEKNINIIDISPYEYKKNLRDAILYLDRRGMPVSIYNIPLCLCESDVRKFCRKSISSWKNFYMNICHNCSQKENCAGFFSTSVSLHEEHIQPIMEEI